VERSILHLAVDGFAIQAERLRCPKLAGRPVALAPADSARPRVLASSREARAEGVVPGTPLVLARRRCPGLIALPPDRDLYDSLSESIRERLAPFAPVIEPGAGGGRFFLDLTGVARRAADVRGRAARAGREIERAFGLHPTLGVAGNKLVSRVAAGVLAPDGELLDVPVGSERAFLAPLRVGVLPSARGRAEAERLDALNLRLVGEVERLPLTQLAAAFGRAAPALWREARGVDPTPVCPPGAAPQAIAEETLARETNDGRVLAAHAERLAAELGAGLRARGQGTRRLVFRAWYADGRAETAQRSFAEPLHGGAELRAAALALLARAVTRRVRVRRVRIEAWGIAAGARQLGLWEDGPGAEGARDVARSARAAALEAALDRVRGRFGSGALQPASWIALGLALRPNRDPGVLRPPARP
jgi:DNA polymerase-4